MLNQPASVSFVVRPLNASDRAWLPQFIQSYIHSARVITPSGFYNVTDLPGFAAIQQDEPLGLVTYSLQRNECEVVTLHSAVQNRGVGSAMLDAVKAEARARGCKRLWLITTNDNLNALRFYQKWGMQLARLYPNILQEWRRIKPEMALIGDNNNIPLRDAIELEL